MGFVTQEHFQAASRHFASYFKGKSKKVSVDGETYKYLEVGSDGAETILFLHGLGSTKSMWRSQMQGYCDQGYRRIAIDIPGACLEQSFDSKKHSLNELSRWLDKMFEQLALTEVHVVAHSTMTLLASFYAATRKNRIKSLTMISVPDIWSSSAMLEGGPIDNFKKAIDFKTVEDAIDFFNMMFFDPPTIPKTLHKLSFNQHQQHMDLFLRIIDEFIESAPLVMSHTRKVNCPLLIMNGIHDPYSSESFVNSLHWHFPSAQVVTFSKSGHVPMLEQPVEVVGLHNEFIRDGVVRNLKISQSFIHSNYSAG